MSLPNTAGALTRSTNFPAQLVPEFFNKIKGHSSLAKMAASEPVAFNGSQIFTFNFDNEIEVVAEAGAKAAGGATLGVKTVAPIKVEYGMRTSDEFLYASEEYKLNVLGAFADGFAKKLARGMDIMAFYGINPRTGSDSDVVGTNNFGDAVSNSVTYLGSSSTADENVEAAVALVTANDYEVNGFIGGKTIRAALAALEGEDGRRIYPELAWGAQPGAINGLPVDFNSTVEYNSGLLRGIVGDFDCFKWGIAKELPIEVIRYGNPDNDGTAGDLAGHNQVYIRGEAYIGWAIMDASAFALIEAAST